MAGERFISGFGSVEFALSVANCVCIAGGHGRGEGQLIFWGERKIERQKERGFMKCTLCSLRLRNRSV